MKNENLKLSIQRMDKSDVMKFGIHSNSKLKMQSSKFRIQQNDNSDIRRNIPKGKYIFDVRSIRLLIQ